MSTRVFFSHSMRDRAWTERLASQTRQIGIVPYLAEHDPGAGTGLAAKVQRNLSNSHATVALLSRHGAVAPYVREEIGWALAKRKLVIPLVQPGEEKRLSMLQGKEYIPFDFDNPEHDTGGLLVALTRVVEQQWRQEFHRGCCSDRSDRWSCRAGSNPALAVAK